jgi:hypothetical protein
LIFFKVFDNIKELNFYFLLGFILGNGNISVLIRESANLPLFAPRIIISQKVTEYNSLLFDNIGVLLKNENIISSKYISGYLIYFNNFKHRKIIKVIYSKFRLLILKKKEII